jgi:UDP-N-acetylglucosamine transferase subunit ALG13
MFESTDTESKKIVFITVGTTSFDPLINETLSKSFAKSCLIKFGPSVRVLIQIGRGIFSPPVYALNVKETITDASSGEAIRWSFNIELSNTEMDMELKQCITSSPSSSITSSSSSTSSSYTNSITNVIKKRKRIDSSKDVATLPIQVHYEIYRFKPNLVDDFKSATFVISHAGAGSVFEALRLFKPLLVVINPVLADNHQTELADALSSVEGTGFGPHLQWCTPEKVTVSFSTLDFEHLNPLPLSNLSRFTTALDRIVE